MNREPPFSRETEKQFQLVGETTPNGVVVVDTKGRIELVNAHIVRLFGYKRGELIGESVEKLVPVRLRMVHTAAREQFNKDPKTRPMGAGRDLYGRRKDGTEFPVEIALNAIKGRHAQTLILATVVDITERKRAEDEIAEQRERLRLVIESAPNGLLTINAAGRITLVNAHLEKLFGYAREELIGQPVEMLVPVRLRKLHAKLREDFNKAPESRPMGAGRDLYGRRKDGTEFPVEIGLNAVAPTGKGDLVLAIVVDITERKSAQQRQDLLVREIMHRTKNLLAVVQAIATRSLSGERSLEEARNVFIGRLLALSRTDTILTESSLQGIELSRLLREELASFPDQVDMQGCDLFLNPRAAQDFALLVHELTTNASKYGALSRSTGSVSIVCDVQQTARGQIHFRWCESGGPAVIPPSRRGFGLNLIERIGLHSGNSAELRFETDGLKYDLRVSLETITASPM